MSILWYHEFSNCHSSAYQHLFQNRAWRK